MVQMVPEGSCRCAGGFRSQLGIQLIAVLGLIGCSVGGRPGKEARLQEPGATVLTKRIKTKII